MNCLSGSDILAHTSACDPKTGIVTPEARTEVMERTQEYCPPELPNRLDTALVINKLSHESILAVVSLRLEDVAHRLKNRRISLDVDGASGGHGMSTSLDGLNFCHVWVGRRSVSVRMGIGRWVWAIEGLWLGGGGR